MIEREHEKGPGDGLIWCTYGIRPHVLFDPEMLIRAVYARGLGVRIDRLEADAECADLGEISGLPAFAYPADTANVIFREGLAVVRHLQAIFEELEGELRR